MSSQISQISQLINYIKASGYLEYSKVKNEAERINPLWKPATWERGLRRSRDIKAVHKNNKILEVIVGYEAVVAMRPLILKQLNFII